MRIYSNINFCQVLLEFVKGVYTHRSFQISRVLTFLFSVPADYYNVVEDLTQSNARGFWVAPLPHHFTVNEASAIFSHFSGLQEVQMPRKLGSLKGDIRPIAYLTFHTPELATVAFEAIDGIFIRYERIRASVSCPIKQPVEKLLADANVPQRPSVSPHSDQLQF
eukprot:EG_transcript_12717